MDRRAWGATVHGAALRVRHDLATKQQREQVRTFFFLATSCSLWDHSSLTRDWTQACNSESVESYPLDHQGIPSKSGFKTALCLPQCCHFTRQPLPPSPCSLLPCSSSENTPNTRDPAEDQQCRQSTPETAVNLHDTLACSPFPFWKDLCLGTGT